MEEVHQIAGVAAEARHDLLGDPYRAIAEGMSMLLPPSPAAMARGSSCRQARLKSESGWRLALCLS
jgi:hypothetical protein